MAEKTHQGSCHCGAVTFRVELDRDQPAIACNCSMCARAGTLLAFVPEASFLLEQGADNLTEYLFHKRVIHHVFCKTCGIKPFGRGPGPDGPMVAINVRCLDGFDLADTKTHAYDGKSV